MSTSDASAVIDFQLPKTLTIYDVGPLEREFRELESLRRGVKLKVSSVEEIDGAGLQWLLAVKARVEEMGGQFSLDGTSESLVEVAVLSGVAAALKLNAEAKS